MKVNIPEGYTLVHSFSFQNQKDGLVQKVLMVKNLLKLESSREAKLIMSALEKSDEKPYLLKTEYCNDFQNEGCYVWGESWLERKERESEESSEKERRTVTEKAEKWYKELSLSDQLMVDILVEGNKLIAG